MALKIQFLSEKILSNKDIALNSLKMISYPNPVVDNLMLEFNTSDSPHATVKIADIHGRLIHNTAFTVQPNENNVLTLALGEYQLTSGVYLIQLINGNKIFSKKIMFQK